MSRANGAARKAYTHSNLLMCSYISVGLQFASSGKRVLFPWQTQPAVFRASCDDGKVSGTGNKNLLSNLLQSGCLLKSLITVLSLVFLLVGCEGSDRVIHGANPAAGTNGSGTPDNSNSGDGNDTTDGTDTDGSDTGDNNEDNSGSGSGSGTDNTDGGNGGDSDNGSNENTDDTDNTDNTDDTDDTEGEGEGEGENTTPPAAATGLSVRHESGQTFLTWDEVDDTTQYHVYRSSQPITTSNLASAAQLTSKWGAIDQDSSMNKYGTVNMLQYLVIEERGSQLSDTTGLFVYTTQPGEAGDAYYAVTSVGDGGENTTIVADSNTNATAVTESVTDPKPVLVSSFNDGKSRTYTHFMDYADWNPTLNGYAFSYFVTLPENFVATESYPLQVSLHEFGGKAFPIAASEYNWETIQVFPSDPGLDENTMHTWWYGYAADHNYKTDGLIPDSGSIRNFTEARVMRTIKEVIDAPDIPVDTDLIHAVGNSMGASGALSLGLRYPSIFTGIYASQPMTNYVSSPLFQENFMRLWGEQQDNLPNIISGPYSESISKYSAEGTDAVAIWDWMNHHQQIPDRRADDFAYMIIDIGKADTTIDYPTQGAPFIQALTEGKAPFTALLADGIDHRWRAFSAVNVDQFALAESSPVPWHYPNSTALIALQNASGSGPVVPNVAGDDTYNMTIEWSTQQHAFHSPIVETANSFAVSLRSTNGAQTASVTPRNTQSFKPAVGAICSWNATRNSDDIQIASGQSIADANALLTVHDVPVPTGTGSRLSVTCP